MCDATGSHSSNAVRLIKKPYTFLFGSTIKPTPVGKDQDGKYARCRHINSREVVWP